MLIDGIRYNFKGLKLGLKTPTLLALGMVRFVLIFILTIINGRSVPNDYISPG